MLEELNEKIIDIDLSGLSKEQLLKILSDLCEQDITFNEYMTNIFEEISYEE